jgi:hypothetical protein
MKPSSRISAPAGASRPAGQFAAPHARALAAQQAGEFVFGQGIRHWRHRGQHRGRIGADRHQHGERLLRMRGAPVGVVQCAAAMRQPAHDDPVRPDHLLAVDRHILPRFAGAARHHQAERDQLAGVVGPAVLDRQAREIDVAAPQCFVFERGLVHTLRCHVRQLRQFRPGRQRLAQAGRPAWLLDRGEQLAEFAQGSQWPPGQSQFDAPAVAEQVAQQRMR